IRGKVSLCRFLVLEGIVPLGEGHRPRVVPDVDHLGGTPHRALAPRLRAGPFVLVDKRPMRVERLQQRTGTLLQFIEGTDELYMVRVPITDPGRQRRAPEPVTGDRPVD